MVAKFLDDKKPKTSLKKWTRTVSDFDDVIQFHLICQMMAKFSGFKSERTEFRKRKRKFLRCALLLGKAGAWTLIVVQRRLRNLQKSVMHVHSCCFADINLLLFSSSLWRRLHRCLSFLLWRSRNFATMVTWRHTSPLHRKCLLAGYSMSGFTVYEFFFFNHRAKKMI